MATDSGGLAGKQRGLLNVLHEASIQDKACRPLTRPS